MAVRGEEDEAELVRLMQERTALSRLVGSIEGKATLNVLTDEGLLPNYAFPEQGVLLRSIIVREAKPGGGAPGPADLRVRTAQRLGHHRTGAQQHLLRRRAAGGGEPGRRLQDQARGRGGSAGSARTPSRCLQGDHHTNCPRCGDTMWRDSGRVREMLKLTTVFARTLDRDSRIADDSDERQRGFYVRQALVDSPPDAVRKAYVIDKPEFPFGFEFLDKVTFREVNFGEQAPDASPMTIAGAEMNRPGFQHLPRVRHAPAAPQGRGDVPQPCAVLLEAQGPGGDHAAVRVPVPRVCERRNPPVPARGGVSATRRSGCSASLRRWNWG
jgi:DEAD/DEAH box helicase domain-containing protein